jgi:hypothetical protein
MYSSAVIIVSATLCVLFAVIGLSALHRQRLSGGTQGRTLAWSIAGLSFLGAAAFGYLVWLRLWVESILRG